MLCQNCGENEANVSYTQIINGVKKEMHLCEKCSKDLGISNLDFSMPISLSSFLGDFFEDEKELLPNFEEEILKCDKCGMTYEEFINTGKFGCDKCYETFSKKIDPILKNIHGGNRHVGRKIITKDIEVSNPKKLEEENQNEVIDNKLEKLKNDLKIAIQEERYEDAANLRDEIKKLEK